MPVCSQCQSALHPKARVCPSCQAHKGILIAGWSSARWFQMCILLFCFIFLCGAVAFYATTFLGSKVLIWFSIPMGALILTSMFCFIVSCLEPKWHR